MKTNHLQFLISGTMNTKNDLSGTTFLLSKLSRFAKTQGDSSLEKLKTSWEAFELVCALEKTIKLKTPVYTWPDINPDIKDRLTLPQEDVGIDYMDEACSLPAKQNVI